MSRAIRTLLIANRGEIAVRIMRTCERMGIATVAVYSEADEGAPHVLAADEAVLLGPAAASESYLSIPKVIEAAKRTGADAVHPGFGFLAENAAFAEACAEAGLIFVGPGPEAIRAMGDKRSAKAIAVEAGVPVVPGYRGEDQSEEALIAAAKEIGFPVLLKASAGGGGKGMRRVDDEASLPAAIAAAKREAKGGFGDETLLIERYITSPRHVEIQIFGDAHGALVHLLERECSIQRRHQKIIEECPSPALGEAASASELRQKMGAAAVAIGEAIGYQSAGTVEFILDQDGAFYFLEVNTRLQVEHPVTELVLDLDLVELQLRVAQGEPLYLDQETIDLSADGAAIECRLYAEDPAAGFLPQSGPVHDFHVPERPWLRVDTGVRSGSVVSTHYDPMIAKVITWGSDRGEAIRRMQDALSRTSVAGLPTNRRFLLSVLGHPAFAAGALSTHFIDEHLTDALTEGPSEEALRWAAVAATLADHAEREAERVVLPRMRSGYRNNRFEGQRVRWAPLGSSFGGEGEALELRYVDLGGGSLRISFVDSSSEPNILDVITNSIEENSDLTEVTRRHGWDGHTLTLSRGGHLKKARITRAGDRRYVLLGGEEVTLRALPRFPSRDAESAADGSVAPMPGAVIKVLVEVGQAVEAGQTLVIMEAMKMEHAIGAPHAGVVSELRVQEGDQVDGGALLAIVSDASEAEEG